MIGFKDIAPSGNSEWNATMSFNGPVSADCGDLVLATYKKVSQASRIFWYQALPIFAASVLLAYLLARHGLFSGGPWWMDLTLYRWWAIAGGISLFSLWILAFRDNLDFSSEVPDRAAYSRVSAFLSPWIAGAAGALLLRTFTPVLQRWYAGPSGMWNVLGFGAPITVLILLGCTVLQVGILGDVFQEPRREWWGRLAAILLILCFTWGAAFALAGYGPLLLIWLSHYTKWLAGLGWVLTTGFGVFGAKSASAGGLETQTRKDLVLSVTPYIFIVGLLMLVSLGIHALVIGHALASQTDHPSSDIEVSISGKALLPKTGNATIELKIFSQPHTPPLSDALLESCPDL